MIPTAWIPAAASTQPGDAPAIAERTPDKPGNVAITAITTATRTATAIPPRTSLRLTSWWVGASCGSAGEATDDQTYRDEQAKDGTRPRGPHPTSRPPATVAPRRPKPPRARMRGSPGGEARHLLFVHDVCALFRPARRTGSPASGWRDVS